MGFLLGVIWVELGGIESGVFPERDPSLRLQRVHPPPHQIQRGSAHRVDCLSHIYTIMVDRVSIDLWVTLLQDPLT